MDKNFSKKKKKNTHTHTANAASNDRFMPMRYLPLFRSHLQVKLMHGYRAVELQVTGLRNQLSAKLPTTASSLVATTRNEALNTVTAVQQFPCIKLNNYFRKWSHKDATVTPGVKIYGNELQRMLSA
jgi:hypothetical protein